MIDPLNKSIEQIFSAPFRSILLKSVGLTILLLVGVGAALMLALDWAIGDMVARYLPSSNIFNWVVGVGLGIGLAFLVGPASALFAGLFTDDIADAVEREYYPQDRPGKAPSLRRSLTHSIKFTVVVILVNILALLIFFLPGINIGIFFLANGYVLGREYFEVSAIRHLSLTDATALRRRHGLRVFAAGLIVAVVMAIPLLNILTPLFATAFLTHVYKQVG